jgi:hypothetical protein
MAISPHQNPRKVLPIPAVAPLPAHALQADAWRGAAAFVIEWQLSRLEQF